MGKVAVIGLGESRCLYDSSAFDASVGVNDIYRYFATDIVVCVDEKEVFAADRMKYINSCTPDKFLSHLDCYSDRPDFQRIELLPYFPNHVCQIDLKQYPKSLCSPFIACVAAYKIYQPREIHLFGVDLINHPHLDQRMCSTIFRHFQTLKTALNQVDVKLIIHGQGILKPLTDKY